MKKTYINPVMETAIIKHPCLLTGSTVGLDSDYSNAKPTNSADGRYLDFDDEE